MGTYKVSLSMGNPPIPKNVTPPLVPQFSSSFCPKCPCISQTLMGNPGLKIFFLEAT